ncbi:hypothetical protein A3A93_04040 [Candidatus Roizmanbacteria bacterium RIFCSPLOWO2_01_FULL_38_12]|uniref:Prepilin-type N-terminal cleavage/methylation domain-containing protein n=1 Tax=Candidatus Roizmanbacteria bacterium RIFCSPLOWO2_01_FULL_38_12 TaxID=1802061 RepID=A0A1F7IV11_9BACT|nr:MAG: hypothetical protein A2861_00585 [Candidatus Roizmanbacteria bacterium RIFCSPHIGHO2_01_FULL_38_15]OGK35022.1 MAG: hypothetical protein A3F59_00215 [Candidatus Roizmanbacteria bacterium RIFCSPHIGHO2_12_FULL_38_13]OGK47177.1 MAG: hypothetical protein A3A93_04040 [Candidatus Roizmanbacteria bacterium RIFCSPLOWO2_01_FULL_38_12]
MFNLIKKGFTLVELVIVIGVIAIIATILLISLNPAETQRKARDTARLKDINTLQGIIEQALNDSVPICAGAAGGTAACRSDGNGVTTASQQPCAANWTGVNLCTYARTVPADPLNIASARCVGGTVPPGTATNDCFMYYWLDVFGQSYEINVRMESLGNAARIVNDGGNHFWTYEVFNGGPNLIGASTNVTTQRNTNL